MRLMVTFFRAYPWHTTVTLLALLLAGIAEGVGLSALLPLLSIAIRNNAGETGQDTGLEQEGELERLINGVLSDHGIDPGIGVLLTIIVFGVTLKNLLLLFAKKQVGYTAAQIATDLRLENLRAILRSRWEFFLHQPVGKVANALATEAHRSSESFVRGAMVITLLIQVFIYGFVAIAVSWKAVLASLAAGTLIFMVSHFLVRRARKAGKKQTRLFRSLIARVTDTLQSVKPLKAMAREHLADSVLVMETTRLNRALRRQVLSMAALNAAQEEMVTIVMAVGMFVALVQFEMPLATVMVLVVVLGKLLTQLGKVQKQYQRVVVDESAFWSMKSAIEEARDAEEKLGAGRAPSMQNGIRLEAVQFAYDERKVLDGLTLDVPAGSMTTLTGPSGCGKTTVIDLVIGLMRPESGSILIDGIPLQDLDVKAWRRWIGYVPQETLLLHDSVAHNVTLGDPELTDADAEAALRAVGAWEFVATLPAGMQSRVGERGGKLSGGQRQRIMIARALVHRPKLLILDEATSALDPSSETAIRQTLEELRGRLTILAITHQKELVEAADRVYRLENGRTVLC